jgi:hypothetical protein
MTPANCKLTPTPADPTCDFKATTTGSVTLEAKGTSGSVMFNKATYNGTSLAAPAATITFDVVAGQTNLDIVYAFSDPANGSGTLNEVCTNNTKLKDISANNTAVSYVICA